jgi:hypothetical protein
MDTVLDEICFCMFLDVTQEKHIGVKDISNKSSGEKQNTHFMVNTFFP